MSKQIFIYGIMALLLLSLLSNVSAITGRLGNSRMILNLDTGETVERSILIQNSNEVPLTIELTVGGDLADSVELNEKSFVLQPGEEKKAYFSITADKPGTTETKIFVRFTPEEGSGVGLTSTVIVIAPGENEEDEEDDSMFDFLDDDTDTNTGEDNTDVDNTDVDIGIGNNPSTSPAEENSEGLSTTSILIISTIVLILIFVVLLIYANSKSKSKKRPRRPRE